MTMLNTRSTPSMLRHETQAERANYAVLWWLIVAVTVIAAVYGLRATSRSETFPPAGLNADINAGMPAPSGADPGSADTTST